LEARKSEGGTRGKSVLIGGEKAPTFYHFGASSPHPPVVACDVFDTKIPIPKAVKMYIEEVIEDPAEWAKLCVNKFGADMITLQLISIDPKIKDTSPKRRQKPLRTCCKQWMCPLLLEVVVIP
jgi:acetyl-CoA decarbonylase/synthase complex subunit delta